MNCPDCCSACTTRLQRTTTLGYAMFRCKHCYRTCNERTGTPFNFLESAKRFCQAFDEVQQFLQPRTRMTELVSLSKQREHFIERVNELQKLFQAI